MAPAIAYEQSRPVVLTHRAAECLKHQSVEANPVVHSARPFVGKKTTKGSFMSAEQFRRTLQEQIAIALSKRVGPGKAMSIKELANALRVDQQTVWKLLNGYNSPSGPVLMALIAFFDSSFANEILEPAGCQVAKIGDARAHALRKVAEGMAELRKLG